LHRAEVTLASRTRHAHAQRVDGTSVAGESTGGEILEEELDLVFVVELEVPAGSAGFGEDDAITIREQTLGLGRSRIDTQHPHWVKLARGANVVKYEDVAPILTSWSICANLLIGR
jgi:hypothetical protein